jgi:hypothetical protein
MYAIEFTTKVKNGIIEIPQQFRDKFRDAVKVIVLADEPADSSDNIINQLLNTPLEIDNFKPFSRDEAAPR